MTTPAAETATSTETPTAITPPVETTETETAPDLAAEVEKWKSLSQKNEQRAKANATAAKELEDLRKQAMTDVEKATAEAEQRGALKATQTFGERLVRSDFTAAAARVNPDFDVAGVLDDLNLTKFVGEDGEPDTEAIKKAVERMVPPSGSPRPPSFDGGARTAAPASVGMNDLIRKAVGRA